MIEEMAPAWVQLPTMSHNEIRRPIRVVASVSPVERQTTGMDEQRPPVEKLMRDASSL